MITDVAVSYEILKKYQHTKQRTSEISINKSTLDAKYLRKKYFYAYEKFQMILKFASEVN